MWIPFFGWYIMKMRMIPVDRGSRSKALKAVVAATRREMARRPPADHLSRRHAACAGRRAGLQIRHRRDSMRSSACRSCRSPMSPASSGRGASSCAIPARSRRGSCKPIPPGLDREEFMRRLIAETEAACDELLVEAARLRQPAAVPPTAVKRLKELGGRSAAGLTAQATALAACRAPRCRRR